MNEDIKDYWDSLEMEDKGSTSGLFYSNLRGKIKHAIDIEGLNRLIRMAYHIPDECIGSRRLDVTIRNDRLVSDMDIVIDNFVSKNSDNLDLLRSKCDDLINIVNGIRSIKGAEPFVSIGDILRERFELKIRKHEPIEVTEPLSQANVERLRVLMACGVIKTLRDRMGDQCQETSDRQLARILIGLNFLEGGKESSISSYLSKLDKEHIPRITEKTNETLRKLRLLE